MVVGFNHNVMYKGEVFHIQTEDSGINTPHIITLLYRGGTILASKKTSYADIIKIENLEQVVEELMKEQHKEMLRRLKAGEFDDRAFPSQSKPTVPPVEEAKDAAVAQEQPDPPPTVLSPPAPAPVASGADKPRSSKMSLDEIILDYLVIGDDN